MNLFVRVALVAGLALSQGAALAQSESRRNGAAAAADSNTSTTLTTAENTAGAKGARTYCFMRGAGNTHKVSWDAAYGLIKRQSASLFKTSPEHAAVMITEAVVNNPTAYPDCGKYLGDLFVR